MPLSAKHGPRPSSRPWMPAGEQAQSPGSAPTAASARIPSHSAATPASTSSKRPRSQPAQGAPSHNQSGIAPADSRSNSFPANNPSSSATIRSRSRGSLPSSGTTFELWFARKTVLFSSSLASNSRSSHTACHSVNWLNLPATTSSCAVPCRAPGSRATPTTAAAACRSTRPPCAPRAGHSPRRRQAPTKP